VAFGAGALGITGVAIATPSPLSAAPVALLTAALKTAAASQITNVHYYQPSRLFRPASSPPGYAYPYQGYAYPSAYPENGYIYPYNNPYDYPWPHPFVDYLLGLWRLDLVPLCTR
jgi:hypothetical protein